MTPDSRNFAIGSSSPWLIPGTFKLLKVGPTAFSHPANKGPKPSESEPVLADKRPVMVEILSSCVALQPDMPRSAPFPLIAILPILLLVGCGDPQIQSYRVKKDPVPATSAQPAAATPDANAPTAMASTPVSTADGQSLQWTAPDTWTAKAASSMRRGTYVIKGTDNTEAELAITAFPGDVGGDLANVNRWRAQLTLSPIAESDLARDLSRFTANGLNVAVVDLAGQNGQRVLGAIVPYSGSTWFFKLTGPDALVAREKPAFLAYLKTVRAPQP